MKHDVRAINCALKTSDFVEECHLQIQILFYTTEVYGTLLGYENVQTRDISKISKNFTSAQVRCGKYLSERA